MTVRPAPPSTQPVTAARPAARAGGAGRGLSLRTLVILRWLALAGQTATILFAHGWLHFPLPLEACLAVILAGALVNIAAQAGAEGPAANRPAGRALTIHIGFDIVQLSLLLGLTGGLSNPFCLLLLAPVTVAAATLPARRALVLGGLALAATAALFFWSLPLPWRLGVELHLPGLYRLGMGMALVVGVVFTAVYAWRIARDADRLGQALAATQDVLEREQRLAALGGLAAAAAHELGTPLATIQVVARELLREAKDGPVAEDARLLVEQAERCRDILRRLSQRPDDGDPLFRVITLPALLEEVSDPHRGPDLSLDIRIDGAAREISGRRLPEVVHALSGLIENAADFAAGRVVVAATADAERIVIEIADDGPGFAPEVLARLGDPYVSRRPGGRARGRIGARRGAAATVESGEGGAEGLGLGFFIARTLLERTGATVRVLGPPRPPRAGDPPALLPGARVIVSWPRALLEASEA